MTFNEWFLSLPKEQQVVLQNDKWLLAQAAYDAGFCNPSKQEKEEKEQTK